MNFPLLLLKKYNEFSSTTLLQCLYILIIDKSKEINHLDKEMNNILALEYLKPFYYVCTKTANTVPCRPTHSNFQGTQIQFNLLLYFLLKNEHKFQCSYTGSEIYMSLLRKLVNYYRIIILYIVYIRLLYIQSILSVTRPTNNFQPQK